MKTHPAAVAAVPDPVSPGVAPLDPDLVARYAGMASEASRIDPEFYRIYNVKRGLRNADGSGVLVGLTTVASVVGYSVLEQEIVPVAGRLLYRGIEIRDIVRGFQSEGRFGFEEVCFLLLMGHLPTKEELAEFSAALDSQRPLPNGFKEDAILGMPSPDVMNKLARCVLASYAFDRDPDGTDIPNVLRQSIGLIARFPTYAVYGYQAKAHYHLGRALMMRYPDPTHGTAENVLTLIRESGTYTQLEAETLDLALILHAEHGGGNNSSFVTHVITSSFSDMYSTVAAATLSLKGSRHGGANLRTMRQMMEMKRNIRTWTDHGEVADYIAKIVRREAGDGTGLVYGLGHAVYTISDPRAQLLKEKAKMLAEANDRMDEFALYDAIETLGPGIIRQVHPSAREVCANVDLYSGFVYDMLGIPQDLYTPLFAVGRVVGWCAHRMEELVNGGPIIRPAYKPVYKRSRPYEAMEARG